jgi:hypothetical protein
MGLFPGEEIGLGGDGIFPLIWVILVVFIDFFGLFFHFLEFLLFFRDILDFFFNLPNLGPINPDIFTLLIRNILTKSYLIVTDTLAHLVAFHFVALDNIVEHLRLACSENLFLYF